MPYFKPASSGSGGAGGGVALTWLQTGGNSPVQDVYSNDSVFLFDNGLAQELYSSFKVPDGYSPGNPLSLKIIYTSPDVSGNVLFRTQTTLIIANSTAFTATTNQYTATNVAATLSATANRVNTATIDLTNSTGQINAVSVSAGDTIKVRIYRDTDTATSNARLHTNQYEVTLS